MALDGRKNFAFTEIATPSVSASATSFDVVDGSVFPTPPFNVIIFKDNDPLTSKQNNTLEIARVTDVTTNTITLTRDTEPEGVNQSFSGGDKVYAVDTSGTWDKISESIEDARGASVQERRILNDLVVSNAELRYENNLNAINYDGGVFDIFADESKITTSSQITISTLDDGDTLGKVELSEIITNQYDISTTSYSGNSFDFSNEIESSFTFYIGDSGNKLFIGSLDGVIYMYNLPTPYRIDSAVYSGDSFSLTQTSSVETIRFNNDGSKLFTLDDGDNIIYAYDLSINWDITTSSYNLENLNVSGNESDTRTFVFNNDGSKVYIGGNSNDTVYAYDLSTNFDVSTGSYNSESFNYTDETALTGIMFNNDGSKMYILGQTGDKVDEYNLSINFDVSTSSTSVTSFDFNTQMGSPWDISFNNDGSLLYAIDSLVDNIYMYNVGASSGFFSSGNLTHDFTLPQAPNSVVVSADTDEDNGTSIDINIDDGTNTVNVTSANFDTEVDASSLTSTLLTATVNFNGNSVTEVTSEGDYNINLVEYNSENLDISADGIADLRSFALKNDGSKFYVNGSGFIYAYDLSTNYDISTGTYNNENYDFNSQGTSECIAIKKDGTKIYMGVNGGSLYAYDLGTTWDISTAVYNSETINISTQETDINDITFNNDGSKLFVAGPSDVYAYDLGTAWDISTATYNSEQLNPTGQPQALSFNDDGSILFIGDNINDTIHAYDLSTEFDISTAVDNGVTFDTSGQTVRPYGLGFKPDGRKMFIVDNLDEIIYAYDLVDEETTFTYTPTIRSYALYFKE